MWDTRGAPASPARLPMGARMYGLWLLVLFVILPAAAGAALAYVASPDERPGRKVLAIGAAAGAALGIVLGIVLAGP